MTTTYTHLHFRGEDGMGCILPMTKDGLGFREEITGSATFITDGDSSPTSEKFADILERMTRAGLCLQLGSTAPLYGEMRIISGDAIGESEWKDRLVIHATGQDTIDDMRGQIRGMDDQIAEYRKLRDEVEASRGLIRTCGDPELAQFADVAGGISRTVWGLVTSAKGRKAELDATKAHNRNIDAKLGAVEAKLNAYNIHESAAVRQLRAIADRLPDAIKVMSIISSQAEADGAIEWLSNLETEIVTFLTTLRAPIPDA